MSHDRVYCFGQQPCGFFPRRFLVAKFLTARRLLKENPGRVIFFYHDSDHDPRETQTILRHRKTDEPLAFNFAFQNKLQRKYTPLYAKRIPEGWQEKTARQLPAFVEPRWVEAFKAVRADNIADFCLEMYRAMGLLDGVEVVRSGDPAFREKACAIDDCFVDVQFQGECIRARCAPDGKLLLHEGGESYLTLPDQTYTSRQVSPSRDSRLKWMQSVVRCTHYIAGAGEQAYLNTADAPDITFLPRDPIDRSDEAFTDTTF